MSSTKRNTNAIDNIDAIITDYQAGMLMRELAVKYGCGLSTICIIFKQRGVQARPRSSGLNYKLPLSKQEIKAKYESGMSAPTIAKLCNTAPSVILEHLANLGVKRRAGTYANRKYSVDENYFEDINTPEKAYWLGFLYADGYNNEKKSSVALYLSSQDLCVVESFKDALKSEAPIVVYRDNRGFEYCRFTVNNQKLSRDLAKQGCMQAKTFLLTFPQIDEKLQADFMRGYFDGDGSIWSSTNSSCMDIAGTEAFLKAYQQILMKACNLKETQLSPRKNIHILRYGGRDQLKRIFIYLYPEGCLRLARKYDKFKSIIEDKPTLVSP